VEALPSLPALECSPDQCSLVTVGLGGTVVEL